MTCPRCSSGMVTIQQASALATQWHYLSLCSNQKCKQIEYVGRVRK